jgi:L-ribulose-5-phosphate 3-epimerase
MTAVCRLPSISIPKGETGMKIGLNSGIFPATWDPSQKVEATARVGAAGLEINIDANQLWTQRLDGAARRALRRQAEDAGVAITSLCLNAHWVFNLASPDVRIRDIGVSLILDAIEMAEDLGATAVLVPGCDQDQSPANKWELFRDGVMQGIGRAEKSGVALALEGVGKPFLFDSALLLRMIDDCGGSDSLGIYLDVGNSTRGGMDPAAEIVAAGQRSVLCHVKDWNPNDPLDRRLGGGGVDFPRSLAGLAEIGYDGFLLVELPPDSVEGDVVARESIEFMTLMLQGG